MITNLLIAAAGGVVGGAAASGARYLWSRQRTAMSAARRMERAMRHPGGWLK